jgi:hypothetical protein
MISIRNCSSVVYVARKNWAIDLHIDLADIRTSNLTRLSALNRLDCQQGCT